MNYSECLEIKFRLLPSIGMNGKKLKRNTWLIQYSDHFAVRFYRTEIIKIYPDRYEFYSDGWNTTTTRNRLNRYCPVEIAFFADRGVPKWRYVGDEAHKAYDFKEGMTFPINI